MIVLDDGHRCRSRRSRCRAAILVALGLVTLLMAQILGRRPAAPDPTTPPRRPVRSCAPTRALLRAEPCVVVRRAVRCGAVRGTCRRTCRRRDAARPGPACSAGPSCPIASAIPGGSARRICSSCDAGGHLLGVDRGLDAVEQPLEPADQLGLGDPQLALAGRLLVERQRQPLELLDQLRGEAGLELLDRRLVDLLQALAARLVERRRLHLLEQLPDHAADPHHLGGLLDQLGDVALLVVVLAGGLGLLLGGSDRAARHRPDGLAVGADDDDVLLGRVLAHAVQPRGQGVSTILPMWLLSSISRWASATRSSGSVACTIGRTWPSATSGHTCSTTEAAMTAFSSAGPGAQRGRDHGAALAQQRAEVELALRAALHADDHEPALGGEGLDVAAEVLRAHVVEDRRPRRRPRGAPRRSPRRGS